MTTHNSTPINPLELLKSASAALNTVPGEYSVEHANVLQLERAANYLINLGATPDTFDSSVYLLGETTDGAAKHIGECDVCLAGVRQFFDLFY